MKTSFFHFLCLSLFVFSACHQQKTSSRVGARTKGKPAWITNRPVASGYYTGIGVATVNMSGSHIDVAKNNALNDIVSEISVTISSNAVIRQFENTAEFKEEFESFSKATIRDNIEGYELVDSWGDDLHYWVYYKLSKEIYREVKERKLKQAKALAYDFYRKGRERESVDDIANALSFYLKAMSALRYHLDEEMSMMTDDGKILLANEVLAAIVHLYSRLEITADQNELYTKIARPIDSNITFTAIYKKEEGTIPVGNLPFRIYFKRGAGDVTPSTITNEQGRSAFKLGRVTANMNFQEIAAEVDVLSMLEGDDAQSELLGEMLRLKYAAPAARVQLVVAPLVAYYAATELEFGGVSRRKALTNEIRTYLAENFFTFTSSEEEADVKVILDARAVKGGYNQMHDLYTVFIDCYLSIYDASTGHKVLYKGFDQIRGQQVGGLENALKVAQSNTLQRIRTEVMPEIHGLDF